ncbi:PilN domain-containing protein [Erwinia sp. 9145]|uniref:PilN domain-containing protein n=1 Tax=Erwinia sp. 9145 TaxID=1500895 RepID=UPI00055436E6|nr:PilN domain-containing protein [Erwinia sp. 9145]
MVWVNLLPWRQTLFRKSLRRDVGLLVLIMLFSLAAALPVSWQQRANTQRLKSIDIHRRSVRQATDVQQRVENLLKRKQALSDQLMALQQQRQQAAQWSHFAQSLTTHMPDALWLTEMSKNPESLHLAGFCRDIRDLHRFRQRLAGLDLFQRVDTQKISRDGEGQLAFSLTIALQKDNAS